MYSVKAKYAPFFLFGSAFLWSMSGIFTKSTAWNGICLATLRGMISFAVALFLVRGRKIKLNRVKVMVAVCFFVQGVLFMCANKYTTAANATGLQNTSPLWIILMNGILLKKLPDRREIAAGIALFGGIGLAIAGNLGGGAMLGNMLALLSAIFYAGVFFMSKQAGSDSLESLLLGNACYLILLPFLLTDSTVHATAPSEWVFLLLFASLSGIGAWLCFAVGIEHTSALQANFITMAEPVMAPVWTFIFLNEKVSPLSFAGCALVIGTLLIYNYSVLKSNIKSAS